MYVFHLWRKNTKSKNIDCKHLYYFFEVKRQLIKIENSESYTLKVA